MLVLASPLQAITGLLIIEAHVALLITLFPVLACNLFMVAPNIMFLRTYREFVQQQSECLPQIFL